MSRLILQRVGTTVTVGAQRPRVFVSAAGVPGPSGGGAGGDGITQDQADARYIRLTQRGAPNGVATLDATTVVPNAQIPEPPVDLTVLFENGLA